MIALDRIQVRLSAGMPAEAHVLRGVSLTLPAGEFACLIGSNGAGKSTLLGAIAGDVPVSAGTISIDGDDVTSFTAERRAARVARVFQDPLAGSAASLSIAENLAIAAGRGRRAGFGRALARGRLDLLRARVAELGLGLEQRFGERMGSLSGGQRQALALLMATLAPSSVLLLDEHTAALDPGNAAFVLDLTRRLAERLGLTVLMVTHSMPQALALGTRTLMLHRGEIILDVAGVERAGMGVDDLLARFRAARGEAVAEDRLLAS